MKHRDYRGIKIGALGLFSPVHSNGRNTGDLMIAGWHWKKSVTWRWTLWLCRPQAGRGWRLYFKTQENMFKSN